MNGIFYSMTFDGVEIYFFFQQGEKYNINMIRKLFLNRNVGILV